MEKEDNTSSSPDSSTSEKELGGLRKQPSKGGWNTPLQNKLQEFRQIKWHHDEKKAKEKEAKKAKKAKKTSKAKKNKKRKKDNLSVDDKSLGSHVPYESNLTDDNSDFEIIKDKKPSKEPEEGSPNSVE